MSQSITAPSYLANLTTSINNENQRNNCDILFINPLGGHIPDYETATIFETLKAHGITAEYRTTPIPDDIFDKLKTDWVAVKVIDETFQQATNIIQRIHNINSGVQIIPWGPGCRTESQRRSLPLSLIHGIVYQENEDTFKNILCHRDHEKYQQSVVGLYYPYRPSIPLFPSNNISRFAYPLYKNYDLSGIKHLPVKMSRGCPHRCSFCSTYFTDGPFRIRETQNLLKEIQYHVMNNTVSKFVFEDRSVSWNRPMFREFCNQLIQLEYPITWEASYIVQSVDTGLFFDEMALAGCRRLCFGFVSGSDRILKKMGKPFDVLLLESALALAKSAGIETTVKLMVGFPGEDQHAFDETLRFLHRNRPAIDRIENIASCVIIPGSDLEMNPGRYGIVLPHRNHHRDWHDSSGNTPESRIEKVQETVKVVKDLNIPFDINGTMTSA